MAFLNEDSHTPDLPEIGSLQLSESPTDSLDAADDSWVYPVPLSHSNELWSCTYSHEAVIAAFKDYYAFLTRMYLDEDDVITPPVSGWPDITADVLKDLGKADEVVASPRSIPYT
ncbi:hypothetical protein CLAFUW4_04479 [Fulvia fulva]|uniref:Uncharacterized protein n=1 Tax=Passalora fulva TaxID=5499 RepID=A0A9Q8LF38_PASFU|nr:uncharacterized protein CLAFUR5_04444 [Fulvia fulva]KAK4626158.1 hypothetical protein CLAFUR4_04465 [Fulvia fulva]KAK4627584.1 hypothetical protein CLAFUR0_04468 [Fulvia fulva]UJO16282.1 hypothetical protein CLAFUR5_04444 [Fulvia fulva]WPV13374.1 hypothetical protein CLAFUW4_04479 [Fulvia fulva]WPV28901.1 hypothetical protein CLAFUW7_04471 [Fulvia fulva]